MLDYGLIFGAVQETYSNIFKPRVPYTPFNTIIDGKKRRASTGNMRMNATKCEQIGEGEFIVWVDASIAPYVVYTNEPWISPKWKGAKNPNEKWFEMATEQFAASLASRLNGTLEIVRGVKR